jgi:hypothetical protein
MSNIRTGLATPTSMGLITAEGPTTTFTPGLGGASVSPTLTNSPTLTGRYVRLGPLVFYDIRIVFTTWSNSPSGQVTVTGLPIAIAAGTGVTPGLIAFSNLALSGSRASLFVETPASGTTLLLV